MSLPVESVALAALSTLALAAWWQAVIHGEDRRWFVVAGLAAGGALGIHYCGRTAGPGPRDHLGVGRRSIKSNNVAFCFTAATVAALIAIGVGGLVQPAARSGRRQETSVAASRLPATSAVSPRCPTTSAGLPCWPPRPAFC